MILNLTEAEWKALQDARLFLVMMNSHIIVDGKVHVDLIDEERLNDVCCEIDGIFDSRHEGN